MRKVVKKSAANQPPTPMNEPQIGVEEVEKEKIYQNLFLRDKAEKPKPFHYLYEKASHIYKGKKCILKKMDELDPEGGWLNRGACIKKPWTNITRLAKRLDSLEKEGQQSKYFHLFVSNRDRWWFDSAGGIYH